MFNITAEAGGIPAVYDDAEIARLPQLQNLTAELAEMTTKCVFYVLGQNYVSATRLSET